MLHHTFLLKVIGDVRYLSLHASHMPREGVPSSCFDGLVLDRSLAVASAPYDAIGSETQLLIIWAKGYKVSWPLESSELVAPPEERRMLLHPLCEQTGQTAMLD